MSTEQDQRSTVRVPVEARVTVRFEEEAGFVTADAINISLNGMFIRTQEPRPPGSCLSFDLRLTDGSWIRGDAEVVWRRLKEEESKGRPAGMGILVRQFDQDSRNKITALVTQHSQRVFSR